MGRAPCCDKANVKKGPWSPEEDAKLKEYIEKNGTGANWIALPKKAGLRRCGKSCRLRWLNYLRPNIKHGEFSDEEDGIICSLYASIGSRWSIIAAQLPGRTDNDIKNYWNTKLKKKLMAMGASNQLHTRRPHQSTTLYPLSSNVTQNPSIVSPYSSSFHPQTSSLYQCGKFYEPGNFTTVISSNISSTATAPSALQVQDEYVVQMSGNKYSNQVKDGSSSDGSCVTNQNISPGSDPMEQRYTLSGGDHQSLCYFGNSVVDDHKFLINDHGYSSSISAATAAASDGCFGTDHNPMDYGMEEIKQLISTNNGACNNLNFFVDDMIKTEENVLHY